MIRLTAERVAHALGVDPTDSWFSRSRGCVQRWALDKWTAISELLRSAIEVAHRTPVTVDQAGAADWLADRLGRDRAGAATVVFHSIMWGYMTDDERARVAQTLTDAGERATTTEPLAWLRMEPGADETDVTLTTWPGGDERVLAAAGYHGRPVRWLSRSGRAP